MTANEAIAQLRCNTYGDFVNEDDLEAFTVAISALEKQIPKKTEPDRKYYGVGVCPTCNAVFLNNLTNYCGNCGQALDWSGTE